MLSKWCTTLVRFRPFHLWNKFCARRFNDREMNKEFYILQAVKSLRNACAHNSSILNNLRADRPQFKPSYVVTRELSTIAGIGLDQRKSKMSNDRMQQIELWRNALYAQIELCYQHNKKQKPFFGQSFVRGFLPKGGHPLFL